MPGLIRDFLIILQGIIECSKHKPVKHLILHLKERGRRYFDVLIGVGEQNEEHYLMHTMVLELLEQKEKKPSELLKGKQNIISLKWFLLDARENLKKGSDFFKLHYISILSIRGQRHLFTFSVL